MPEECSIMLISFDNLTVYSFLFSPHMSEEVVHIVKLHTCPSDICDMEIVCKEKLSIIIALNVGSLITLCLEDRTVVPKLTYLNIPIYKYLRQNESLIYTDGDTMWMSENIHSEEDITFRQFIVRQVKDFAKCREQIICTTYTNMIYVLLLDDDAYFVKSSDSIFTPASKLLNNSECFYLILDEIEKNNDMIKMVQDEGNYITTLALSNRQDLMDDIIQYSVVVYENYQEAIIENKDLILTDNIDEYFKEGALMFVVKIRATTLEHMFSNMISNLLNNFSIHVTLSSDYTVLKTASIKLKGSLRRINILIGLNIKKINIFEVVAMIKIVLKIPGLNDPKQLIWTTLCRKEVPLYSEHLIKCTTIVSTNVLMKEPANNIDDLIYKVAYSHHRHLFKIINGSKVKSETLQWSMYLKLPINFKELLADDSYCRKNFSSSRAHYLHDRYTMPEFLNSKINLSFDVGKEKVKLEIISDEPTSPMLKVTSENIKIAFNIRNFFSNLIYNNFKNSPQKEYVMNNLYYITESIQKELKSCILDHYVLEKFHPLADQFERRVIGAFPI
ncbi:uncharacterized protein ACR2FA_004573 [Aphomia sociella]